jgi:antitoxin PrlF
MKLTQKGQVTIPRDLRNLYGLHPRTEVVFEAIPGGVLVRPAPDDRVRRLRSTLKRVRGTSDTGRTTDSILSETREL